MVINLNLRSALARIAVFIGFLLVLTFAVKLVLGQFMVSALSSRRVGFDSAFLTSATDYFPGSGSLFARLAETKFLEGLANLEAAEEHANQAIKRSPYNYNYRLLLGKIRLARGNQAGAEEAIRDALQIVPTSHVVHWRLANVLVGAGKIDESLEHFRFAVKYNPTILPTTLDLIWQASRENIDYLSRVIEENPQGQVKLALFLASKSRMAEAVEIFAKIDRETLNSSPDTSPFLDNLISKGFHTLARDLWMRIKSPGNEGLIRAKIWNGDFETKPSTALKQFDWRVEKSQYARIFIDDTGGHSGTHSLLIDFLGRDTTSLDNEISQSIVLRSGANYQLTFFVKTEKFFSPNDGANVVVTLAGVKGEGAVVQSKFISSGDEDWRQMSVDFKTPQNIPNGVSAVISIKRKPRYDFDEPTRGRIRFDDFTIREQGVN